MKYWHNQYKSSLYWEQLIQDCILFKQIDFRVDIDKEKSISLESDYSNVLLKKNRLGGLEGYIYFKPINISFDIVQVIMNYIGDPGLQYFNTKQGRWVTVLEGNTLSAGGNIKLRIHMSKMDRILALVLFVHKKDLYDGYSNVKILDFGQDIDSDKSGKYLLDKAKNSILFLYQPEEYIGKDDIVQILGRIETDINGISLIPTDNSIWGPEKSDSQFLISRTVDGEHSKIIYTNIALLNKGRIRVILGDKAYFDIMNKSAVEDLRYYFDSMSDMRRLYMIDITNYSISCTTYIGTEVIASGTLLDVEDSEISLLINLREKYFTAISSSESNRFDMQVPFTDPYCLSITLNSYSANNTGVGAIVKDLIYADDTGYINFTPIKVSKGKAMRAFIAASGSAVLESYDSINNCWVELTREFVPKEDFIKMRVKIQCNESLTGVILAEV